MRGQRHLVRCRCVLPQFKSSKEPPAHQFVVFSVIKDDESVVVKHSQCNNCGIIHKVVDICKSEIVSGKEASSAVVTIDDIKGSIPQNLSNILERNNSDISAWESAQFIIENKRWGDIVVLSSEEESGVRQGKYVRIMSETFFKVESYSRDEVLVLVEDK